jgi:hypothetical protein
MSDLGYRRVFFTLGLAAVVLMAAECPAAVPAATPASPPSPAAASPSPAPAATPAPTSTPAPAPAAAPTATLSFAHTQPGVQSEVYLVVQGAAGLPVTATLTGPAVASTATQSGVLDASGRLRLVWVIRAFGVYRATGTAGGAPISAEVTVR